MKRSLLFPVLASTAIFSAATAAVSSANAPAGKPAAASMTIHLERNRDGRTEPMRADHVFNTGDVIRFRVSAAQNGYLYVLDQGSSGTYSVLFPAPGSAAGNRIEKDTEYSVPAAGDGWFAIDPPAGFDTIYFLLSPTPLAPLPAPSANPVVPPAPAAAPPRNPALLPRCNDALFRARGECVDSTAGAAPLARDAVLPPQITLAAPHASRDITLAPEEDGTSVAAFSTFTAPVVYTFRLAHR